MISFNPATSPMKVDFIFLILPMRILKFTVVSLGLKLRLTWLQNLQSQTASLLSLPSLFLFMRVTFSLFYFVLIQCSALVELLKHKPKATEEQLKTVLGNFSAFVEKCCAAADKEACFAEEVRELSSF